MPTADLEPLPDDGPAATEIPAGLDLPTLSDSMRVNIKKEGELTNSLEPSEQDTVKPVQEPAAETEAKSALAPEPGPDPEPEPKPKPEPEPEPESEPVATVKSVADHAPQAAPVSAAKLKEPALRDSMPAIDAESGNSDIDALEAALEAAKSGELASQNSAPPSPAVTGAKPEIPAEDAPAAVPEITLDQLITDQQSQLAKLDQFRAEIGNVNSLEDVSDVMAETLFGVEFEELAAAAIASPSSPEECAESDPEVAPSPVTLSKDEMPLAANDATELKLEQTDEPVIANDTNDLQSKQAKVHVKVPVNNLTPEDIPLNESTALRIDMLNAMRVKANAMAENVEMGSDNPADKVPAAKGPQPEPIERQMNTSITQTLEALNVAKMEGRIAQEKQEKVEKEEKKSGGLFSRFRKSS